MNKYGMKVAACALAGSLSLSGYQTPLDTKQGSSNVPSAGAAVVLDGTSTIQDLRVEVVQNIAYLESASGLRPNIVLASEKAALADTPASVMRVNAVAADVSTEILQDITEAISEIESEIESEIPSTAGAEDEVETKTETERPEEESLEQETTQPETEQHTETASEITGSEETDSTRETTETDKGDDFPTSAGFSATDS